MDQRHHHQTGKHGCMTDVHTTYVHTYTWNNHNVSPSFFVFPLARPRAREEHGGDSCSVHQCPKQRPHAALSLSPLSSFMLVHPVRTREPPGNTQTSCTYIIPIYHVCDSSANRATAERHQGALFRSGTPPTHNLQSAPAICNPSNKKGLK